MSDWQILFFGFLFFLFGASSVWVFLTVKHEEKLLVFKQLGFPLALLRKEAAITSDGTHLKCTCSRTNCHSLYFSAGDTLYRVNYNDSHSFNKAVNDYKKLLKTL